MECLTGSEEEPWRTTSSTSRGSGSDPLTRGTGEKHIVERDGKTFTAELAPIRDGCRLSVTIAGAGYFPVSSWTIGPRLSTSGPRRQKYVIPIASRTRTM